MLTNPFDKRLFNSNNEYVITSPHVQNLFDGEYPWVVTVCQKQWSILFLLYPSTLEFE